MPLPALAAVALGVILPLRSDGRSTPHGRHDGPASKVRPLFGERQPDNSGGDESDRQEAGQRR